MVRAAVTAREVRVALLTVRSPLLSYPSPQSSLERLAKARLVAAEVASSNSGNDVPPGAL